MILADYNDQSYDYTKYWQGRDYENESEFIALKNLLPSDFSKNRSVVDVGGGFGRLLPVLKKCFGDITIFDYSQKLLDIADLNAKKLGLKVTFIRGDAYEISAVVGRKFDYVTMVRISHHLDDLEKVFSEIRSILNDDGFFILEVANKIHFKSVVTNLLKRNFKYFDKESISVATKNVTFLNHHPKHVEEILNRLGFVVEKKLSVSNFRARFFKKTFPLKSLLRMEKITQNIGSRIYFGPSIFYLLRRK